MHTSHRFDRLGRLLILGAVLLRIGSEPLIMQPIWSKVKSIRSQNSLLQAMLYLELGEKISLQAPPLGGFLKVHCPEAQAVFAPLTFSASDSERISIYSTSSYEIDKQTLLNQPLAGDFSGDGPKILIVHTHASECYSPDWDEDYHSMDTEQNMVRVGTEMARIFEQNGISVLHESGINDANGYDNAYARMSETIEAYLEEYPTIQMVLDVHRDAYEAVGGGVGGNVVEVDGAESAQLMLVMGTDENGDYHPNWQGNLSCALKTQAVLQAKYPNLCRNLVLRRSDYNEALTPCSMLVEVGASGNTLEQALTAARCFAQAVCTVIQSG